MIVDSTKFIQDTNLKAQYSFNMQEVEFIVEQNDENGIGLFCRMLWSTMYDDKGALFCKYTSEPTENASGISYMVFSHINRALSSMPEYYYNGDLSKYQCSEDESLYSFEISSNFKHGDGMPGWALVNVISGACVTNSTTDAFAFKMKHLGGFPINVQKFETYRATYWAPGADPWQGGGYGCTDIWIRQDGQSKHIDLRGRAYETAYRFNLAEMPNEVTDLQFSYS